MKTMSKRINKYKARLREAFSGVDREKLAEAMTKKVGNYVSRNQIDQIAAGHKKVSAKRAVLIESLSGIPRRALRPDLFDY